MTSWIIKAYISMSVISTGVLSAQRGLQAERSRHYATEKSSFANAYTPICSEDFSATFGFLYRAEAGRNPLSGRNDLTVVGLKSILTNPVCMLYGYGIINPVKRLGRRARSRFAITDAETTSASCSSYKLWRNHTWLSPSIFTAHYLLFR